MDYKASFDTLAKGLTAGTFILLAVLGYRSVKVLLIAHGDMTTILIHSGLLLLFSAILGCSYIYSPQKYILNDDSLVIKRPISDITISLNDIEEVRLLQSNEMTSTVRTFGNGGLFGYYGKYHNPQLGHMTFYTTKRDDQVLIRTKGGEKIIITPDDKSLVDEIKKKDSR